MKKKASDSARPAERWARRRFSIVGQLLASPPPHGELQREFQKLSKLGSAVRRGTSVIARVSELAYSLGPVQEVVEYPDDRREVSAGLCGHRILVQDGVDLPDKEDGVAHRGYVSMGGAASEYAQVVLR